MGRRSRLTGVPSYPRPKDHYLLGAGNDELLADHDPRPEGDLQQLSESASSGVAGVRTQ